MTDDSNSGDSDLGERRRPAGNVRHPAEHSSAPEPPALGVALPVTQITRSRLSRRELFKSGVRGVGLLGFGATAGMLAGRDNKADTRWQINPDLCIQCGRCATACVLKVSAVKCTHSYGVCGYCKLCTGYFEPEPINLDEGAENQLCPTGAIKREFIEDPYYEYSIIKELCIGCGKCVKGCNMFGNGSLYLQVNHDRCVNCDSCAIARECPAQAFVKVPATRPYLLRGKGQAGK